jgi:hypothetical protein
MTEIRFQLQQMPNQKWRLTENPNAPEPIDRGVYDNPALAATAVKIILNPPCHYYDKNGDEIK